MSRISKAGGAKAKTKLPVFDYLVLDNRKPKVLLIPKSVDDFLDAKQGWTYTVETEREQKLYCTAIVEMPVGGQFYIRQDKLRVLCTIIKKRIRKFKNRAGGLGRAGRDTPG